MRELRQATAATVTMGPFVDSADGVTLKTALVVQKADIILSKAGGSGAAATADQGANDVGAPYDTRGNYKIALNTGDTDTVGPLRVDVQKPGALPVYADFMVLTGEAYDAKYASGKCPPTLAQIEASTALAKNQTVLEAWRSLFSGRFLGIKGAAWPITAGYWGPEGYELRSDQSVTVSAVDAEISGGSVVLTDRLVIARITSSGVEYPDDWGADLLSCSAIKISTSNGIPEGSVRMSLADGGSMARLNYEFAIPAMTSADFWVGSDGTLWSDPDEVGQVIPGDRTTAAASCAKVLEACPGLGSIGTMYRDLLGAQFLGTDGLTRSVTVTFNGDMGEHELQLYDGPASLDNPGYDGIPLMGVLSGGSFVLSEGWDGGGARFLWIETTGPVTSGGVLTISDGPYFHRINVPATNAPIISALVDCLTGELVTLYGKRYRTPLNSFTARGRTPGLIAG